MMIAIEGQVQLIGNIKIKTLIIRIIFKIIIMETFFKVKYNSLVNTGHDWTSKQSQKSKAAATSLIGDKSRRQLIRFEICQYTFDRCGKNCKFLKDFGFKS